ncbi:hypothetical protein ACYF6T_43370 [Streptomyces sp. 7R007]
MHPTLNGIGPDLIAVCDQEAAHGNFRTWAKTTHYLNVGMRQRRLNVGGDLPRWDWSKLRPRRSA